MITALVFCLWLFGVAAVVYGGTLLHWAWHSPEDAQAARLFILGGLVACGVAVGLMQ